MPEMIQPGQAQVARVPIPVNRPQRQPQQPKRQAQQQSQQSAIQQLPADLAVLLPHSPPAPEQPRQARQMARAGQVRRYNQQLAAEQAVADSVEHINTTHWEPSLALADYFDERGDPRGRLIRRHVGQDEPSRHPETYRGPVPSATDPITGLSEGPVGWRLVAHQSLSGDPYTRLHLILTPDVSHRLPQVPYQRHFEWQAWVPHEEAHGIVRAMPDEVQILHGKEEALARIGQALGGPPRRESRVRRYSAGDHEVFQSAIMERPLDPQPKLVYADWLQEHGHPGGDYLRALHEGYEHVRKLPPYQGLLTMAGTRHFWTPGPVDRWAPRLPRTMALLSFHTDQQEPTEPWRHPVHFADDPRSERAVAAAELHAAGLMSGGRLRDVWEQTLAMRGGWWDRYHHLIQRAARRVAVPNDRLTVTSSERQVGNLGVPALMNEMAGGDNETRQTTQRKLVSTVRWFMSNHPLARRLRAAAANVEAHDRDPNRQRYGRKEKAKKLIVAYIKKRKVVKLTSGQVPT